jgi:hypothetical protein
MASLDELNETIPAYFTLSNQKLILIAHVRDEIVYFYDQLGPRTTIVLLAEPACYALKKIFLEYLNDIGTTIIDLREQETFDPTYTITQRSFQIIQKLLRENKYEMIITHPMYSKNSDPQNRALYDIVHQFTTRFRTNNHFTYNKIGLYGSLGLLCGVKKGILELYARALNDEDEVDENMYMNYSSIVSNISGVRKL